MKCVSCEIEINPKWKHAIDQNICPFCGKDIMEEHLKNLLSSLCDTMENLSAYSDQLNDWMLSNHNYIKTDSENLYLYVPKEQLKDLYKNENDKSFQDRKDKKFKVKVMTDAGEEEIVAEKIQSEEKTNDFFLRAEAVKPNIDGFRSTGEKTEHLKKMVQQIKRNGNLNMPQGDIDEEAVLEMQALISEDEMITSSLPNSEINEDEIPSIVLNMANKAKGGKDPQADLEKLQRLQSNSSGARNRLLSGNGGFSRA